jgi:uncharacterized repeat protein (TIGR02543 family)
MPEEPTKSGYDFGGWYTAQDGGGERFTADTTVTGNITVYAKWTTALPSNLSLAASLAWIEENAVEGGAYTITCESERITHHTLFYFGKTVSITLLGGKSARRIIPENATLFTVGNGVTLTLDNNITLEGKSKNTDSLVKVKSGGKLVMNPGSKICDNDVSALFSVSGGGVYVEGGTFTMSGGTISGNKVVSNNGGMPGGGGVYVGSRGTFTMSGGTISGNTSSCSYDSYQATGGGVYVDSYSTFTMSGGTIRDNKSYRGGGVSLRGTFAMVGGTIRSNNATSGGGVYVDDSGTFTKSSGGVIYGRDADDAWKNIATNNYIGRTGDAVNVYQGEKERIYTAGEGVTLDSTKSGRAGGWDREG